MKDNSGMNPSSENPSRRHLIWGAGAAAAVAGVGVALWRFEPRDVAEAKNHPFLGSAIRGPFGRGLGHGRLSGQTFVAELLGHLVSPMYRRIADD
uniref:hypothetical protein n=1 Tax=Limnohabitans sp. TaxID=1907725 RepID=UPI004047BE02